ncbi:MAG: phage integrase N-terminal SAM-like domain-containing protein, partial [Tannerellaceae bacterium]|nr:phage integrase N-terminal SAM-like domain-containing protein [Tannerellaceae bacterium]
MLRAFVQYCQSCDFSVSTRKGYCRTAGNFLSFMEARGCPVRNVTLMDLTNYVKTLVGYGYKTVEYTLCGTRVFLRFLHSEHILGEELSGNLPCMKSRRQTRIPSVWDHGDLLKLLNAVDRGNPSGKRDYAIILLVTRLGLRSI